MSCRLRKNFSIGMRRFSRCCSTMMSTHDWWLQLTMYQARYSSSSSPATDQSVRWVSRIQPLLPATQRVAIPFSALSIAMRMGLTGTTSLTSASRKIREHQNNVLIPSSSAATTPRANGGRKVSNALLRVARRLGSQLRQRIFLEPGHRAANAIVAARMIVEENFLDRAGRDLAIGG